MLSETEKRSITGLVLKYNRLTYEKVEQICIKQQEQSGKEVTVTAQNGMKIPVIWKENQIWYMNSIYNPLQAAVEWAKQYDTPEINDYSIFIIFGIGDGRAIRELLKRKPNCFFIVYEPSLALFCEAIKSEIVADLLNEGNVCTVVEGINEEYFYHLQQGWINYANFQLVVQAVLPNYDSIFKDTYKKVLDTYRSIVEVIIFTRNTHIFRSVEMARNKYALASDIVKQHSVAQLKGMVQKNGLEEIPAVLVAAGPSLDKNIEDLKSAKGKAFLMVVDTALNTVLEHGIMPDMTISIDSRKPLELFRNESVAKLPMVLSSCSNKDVVKKNHAPHYYEIDEEGYLNRIFFEVTGKNGVQLSTGGSVANNALSFLVEMMGFRTVILVGQDLAYPEGREHTKAAYNNANDLVSFEKKKYIEVEDIYGNLVLTENNMNLYRKWTEQYITFFSEVRVIDATEGGAKIAGTEIRTLRECVRELCSKEIDWNKILFGMQPFFTEEEQKKLSEKIRQIPDELQKMERLVEEGTQLYEKLEGVNAEQEPEKIMEIVKKVGDLNNQIEEMDISGEVRPYMEEETYAVEAKVFRYREDETLTEQMKSFSKLGLDLMQGYRKGIRNLKGDLPLLLENFAE